MISRCARCCTAVGSPAASKATRTSRRVCGVGPARSDSSTLSAVATTSGVSPSRALTPAIAALHARAGHALHPAQVLGGEQVPGGAQHVGAQPPRRPTARRARRRTWCPAASACRATTPPAGRPATARSRAAAPRRRRSPARPRRAAGWRGAGGARGRGGGRSSAHRRTGHRRGRRTRRRRGRRPRGRGRARRRAPPWSAERPSRHPPSRYTWATHGRSRADVPDTVAPPAQTRSHEYPPPAHRSPQPPPGRPLRRHGQVAVAVRVRSARVLVPEWLARGADGSARPPEPGPGGVAVRPGGNRGSPGRTSPSRVAARAATRRASKRTTRGRAHRTGWARPRVARPASGRDLPASASSRATGPCHPASTAPGNRPLRRRVVQ